MRVGGKVKPKVVFGDPELDQAIHDAGMSNRLKKARKDKAWQLAQAAASDRRMLIGRCILFRSPR